MDGDSVDLIKVSRPSSSTEAPKEVCPQSTLVMSWREQAQRLHREARVSYFVFRHPRTPWYAKLIAVCTAAYLFSPIQLIPNYIPVIGVLDDLLVVFFGVRLLHRITPADVLTESRMLADAAEARGKEEVKSTSTVVVSVVIVTVWFLVAIVASIIMAAYVLPLIKHK